MPKNRTELAAICPLTAQVAREADYRPQSPLRAIRAKPGTPADTPNSNRELRARRTRVATP